MEYLNKISYILIMYYVIYVITLFLYIYELLIWLIILANNNNNNRQESLMAEQMLFIHVMEHLANSCAPQRRLMDSLGLHH